MKYQDFRLTTHHLYFPESDYRTSLERAFRELPENKIVLSAWFHAQLHRHQKPPEKPSPDEMREFIALSSAHQRYQYLLNWGHFDGEK